MTQTHAPHRVDHVGSFLRPQELIQAREEFNAGKIDQAALTEVEDQAIRDLVKKEIQAGLKSVTDGEFRRAYWHLDFFWGFGGIDHVQAEVGYQFHDETTKADSALIVAPITGENHPFVKHFTFLRDLVADVDGVEAKYTIPAPSQFYFELIRDAEHVAQLNRIYPDFADVRQAIQKAYLQVIQDLYEAGLRTLQIDDCTWGVLVDDNFLTAWGAPQSKSKDQVRQELADLFLTLNNDVYENIPQGLTLTTHVCRGNFHSTWASSGGYAPIAEELLNKEKVDAYFLEFDTDRAGGFEPLEKVTPGKGVVLGLLTSKSGQLEDKAEVIARIKEASQYVPLENLYLSTQCGFASTEEGNILTEEDQWKKIALIQEIVDEVWG
ncbi:5-methyltetrahydropteroyltriglutamate--homocysteine S-methyltransferase [Streptococcus sp. DD13]|uniref:5-methyltetrahydropteroyltriglutamate-- homocysteine S-methyltransferase n=1 Tax=Streptococcus sp. DD13 TaxID=1777881 RepID=UPI00079C8A20|nr:5-methyltetrahydropteroyltriglutamate--homocysteine S-methyltransferase [Streptococcus sp. DD13]KXT78427.1 Methionine synthase II (cobalamin-independent) [Streptococcus sp. DD13]